LIAGAFACVAGRVKRARRGSALNDDDKVADLMKDATITIVGVEYEKSLERQSDTQKKRLDLLEQRLQKEPVVLQIDIAKWLQVKEIGPSTPLSPVCEIFVLLLTSCSNGLVVIFPRMGVLQMRSSAAMPFLNFFKTKKKKKKKGSVCLW
jgi:hypothetical protein